MIADVVMETVAEMGNAAVTAIVVVMIVRAAVVMIAKATVVIAVAVMTVVVNVLEPIVNLVIKVKDLNHTLKTNMV